MKTTTSAEYRKARKDGTLHMLAARGGCAVSTNTSEPVKRAQPERELQRAKGPNKWEADYARDVLEPRRLAGEIDSYHYEPVSFVIGFDCRYRPDFGCKRNGVWIEFHEVKGFMRDDARVKLVVTASLFRQFRFVLARRTGKVWRTRTVKWAMWIMEGR